MGVDEMGVDEMGVDEMGSRRSGNKPEKIAFFTANHFCCLLINFQIMVSSVQVGKIMWCLLFRVAKQFGVFCPGWPKVVVSFVTLVKIAWCLLSYNRSGSKQVV